jgi:hypothetical protein
LFFFCYALSFFIFFPYCCELFLEIMEFPLHLYVEAINQSYHSFSHHLIRQINDWHRSFCEF